MAMKKLIAAMGIALAIAVLPSAVLSQQTHERYGADDDDDGKWN